MSFDKDIARLLKENVPVAALVGTRVYWKRRPQNTALPCIVLHTAFGERAKTFDGPMGTQGNRIQFDCMADQRNGVGAKDWAVEVRDAVMAAIEFPGSAGDTEFQGGKVNLYRDLSEDTAAGVVHTEMIDATIWFNEYVS